MLCPASGRALGALQQMCYLVVLGPKSSRCSFLPGSPIPHPALGVRVGRSAVSISGCASPLALPWSLSLCSVSASVYLSFATFCSSVCVTVSLQVSTRVSLHHVPVSVLSSPGSCCTSPAGSPQPPAAGADTQGPTHHLVDTLRSPSWKFSVPSMWTESRAVVQDKGGPWWPGGCWLERPDLRLHRRAPPTPQSTTIQLPYCSPGSHQPPHLLWKPQSFPSRCGVGSKGSLESRDCKIVPWNLL